MIGAFRMLGGLDYLRQARVADMSDYHRPYRCLTGRIDLSDMSAGFGMQEIKAATALPVA